MDRAVLCFGPASPEFGFMRVDSAEVEEPFSLSQRYPNLEVLSDHLASLGISSSQIAHGGIWVVGGSGMVHRESQKPSIRNMSSPFFFLHKS